MNVRQPLEFRVAAAPWEFEEIHRLNYRTFVEEIPQHQPNADGILVDKFHDENTYFICCDGAKIVGMLAIRGRRPFSLDQKLPNLDSYLPPGRTVCEVRLLAVDKNYRHGRVFFGLVRLLTATGRQQGYDTAIISGTTRQERLYRHLGFVPFGPLVGSGEALFQPMYLTLEAIAAKSPSILTEDITMSEPLSFLPGPVAIDDETRRILGQPAVSHRSRAFMRSFQDIKKSLCSLVNAEKVEIFVGSGTLANDVVGGQISLLRGRGLILSNGEFGARLIDHATRWGLDFDIMEKEWGSFFTREELVQAIKSRISLEWIWTVHCETSTTILNDIAVLKDVCRARGLKLCLDCTSSVGTIPMALDGVFLASSVSGKGLGSFPGLSMVFYKHEIQPAPRALPRYLDLGSYAANGGVPYTHSSNLVYALQAALKRFATGRPFEEMKRLSAWLRERLRGMGFSLLGDEAHVSPAIVTIVLPPEISSELIGDRMEESGYLLSYRSGYLLKRNWLQICLMGSSTRERLEPMLELLQNYCFPDAARDIRPVGSWPGETIGPRPTAADRANIS